VGDLDQVAADDPAIAEEADGVDELRDPQPAGLG
jgi:hypothetical protein